MNERKTVKPKLDGELWLKIMQERLDQPKHIKHALYLALDDRFRLPFLKKIS